MSQEQQRKPGLQKMRRRKTDAEASESPPPERFRRKDGGTGHRLLVLVALVGYEGFHMYRSFTPISQGSESMDLVGGGSESDTATEPKNGL